MGIKIEARWQHESAIQVEPESRATIACGLRAFALKEADVRTYGRLFGKDKVEAAQELIRNKFNGKIITKKRSTVNMREEIPQTRAEIAESIFLHLFEPVPRLRRKT